MSLTSCFCTSWKKEVVRVLEFRHCNLTFVPEEVYEYEESLEELYLDSNNIRELPRSLFHCEFLKKLGISDNELCTIPTAVATMIHLEELDISKNGIVELPDNIKCCKNLSLVEISVNPLGRLPEGFTHLINLTQLYLNDTLLDFLPANFGRLTKLKVLELRENHLQSLPKSICRLTELERLDLGQNDFKELPDVVGTLINLKELWVDYNRLTKLPKSIGNLQDLTYFDASCNRIEFLPEETEGLLGLADLHLSKNYLQELPKNLGKLSKLTTLKIDNNQLSCLPHSMGGLASLEELTLKANDLEELPPSIGLLRKLRYLNIDQNMLLTVPAELGSCSNITLLSLCGNYLEILPDEIGRIRSLTVLNLSNNKLKYLPYSFTKLKKVQAMWLSDNQAKPMLQLQSDILDSGKRVLTCFLFPQQRRDPEDDFYISDGDSFHASIWEEQRRERMQIAFNVSESENEHERGGFKKLPSPYPKEGVKVRPRMANDKDSSPWHSSPLASRKTSRHRTSYPKEGIKQRHRKAQEDTPDGRPRLANKINGQAVLPDYPKVNMGRGSKRDGRMREAKISRPRVSTSPITDSLQLFRADKEKMAKDKLRIRHSSPEKTESEGESRSPKKSDVEGDIYSPKKSRVLGRREIKAKHGRGAMSDSETTPNKTKTPKGLRRELLEAQSDIEHHAPSDTQSDMGFRLRRRNWQSPVIDTQSDVEFTIRSKGSNRQRIKDNEKMNKQRIQFDEQLNRNANAATDERLNQSPAGQRIPRRSGYSTDPEVQRSRRRVPVRTSKEAKDDGYVHPKDYYKLPEYSIRNSPARTLNLAQGKGQLGSEVKVDTGQTSVSNGLSPMQGKRPDVRKSIQFQQSPNLSHNKGPGRPSPHPRRQHNGVLDELDDGRSSRPPGSDGQRPTMLYKQSLNPARDQGPGRPGFVEMDDGSSRRPPGPDGQRLTMQYKQSPNLAQDQRRPRSGEMDDASSRRPPGPDGQKPTMQYKQSPNPARDQGPGRPESVEMDGGRSRRPPGQDGQSPNLARDQGPGRPGSGDRSHPRDQTNGGMEENDSGRRLVGSDGQSERRPSGPDGQRPNHTNSRDYVDMSSGRGHSSPMHARTPTASPKKMHIPSYEEALTRRREVTPPRVHSPDQIDRGSSSQPTREQQRQQTPSRIQQSDYELMRNQNHQITRTQNPPFARTQNRSPVRTRNHSPTRTGNPSPTRNQNQTPTRTQNHSPTRTHNHTPMRTQNQTPTRTQNQSATRTENHLPAKGNINNYAPAALYNDENNRNLQRLTTNSNQTSRPPGKLSNPEELNGVDGREHDVERDSGNSSNVTWSENEPVQTGIGQEDTGKTGLRSSAGISTKMEMQPDPNGNDTDSALTESPSPTYSSSGLTPSPQQPHFPQSVRIPSPSSPDGKVPLLSHAPCIVAPGMRGGMYRTPPPPYQPRWAARPEGIPHDSSGYTSDGDQRQGEADSPSPFLIDQRPPSPNSTVLAWDTSAIDNQPLPSNNNSPYPSHIDNRNTAKTIQLVIYKNPGLGFSITGGFNSPGNPYKHNDMGIFVTKIAPSGPADGTLHPGDKLLEVNGHDFTNVSHDDAVALLRRSNPVSVVVERD